MYGPPEQVLVEHEWYDNPRTGIAIVNGQPHRFRSKWDEAEDENLGSFFVWPIGEEELALEQEQWNIFVEWNDRYEAGEAEADSHPAQKGTNKRWDEIEVLLANQRASAPHSALRARAQMVHLERGLRYLPSGPAYQLAWELL
jgi:hypothetical protein